MITAIAFLLINIIGTVLAFSKGPFWALLVYANIYFNSPHPDVNWWANYLPDIRWSLVAFIVLAVSMFFHRDKLSTHEFLSLKWMYVFLVLTVIVTSENAVDPETSKDYTYMLFTFCVIVFALVRSIATFETLKYFILAIIIFCSNLSVKAVLEGKRIHARLENIGTFDSLGSNEFGLLLAGVLPFVLPFLLFGKKTERVICLLAIPLLINAIVLTNSRTALVSLVFGGLYGFAFVADLKFKKYIITFLLMLIPAFVYLADEYFTERMSTLLIPDNASEETLDKISSGRLAIWGHGLAMAEDHPFGVGPGGFRALSRFYMPEEILVDKPDQPYGARAAHNSYLLVLVEQGYLGLCVFLLLCFSTLYYLLKSIKLLRMMDKLHSFVGFMLFSLNVSFLTILIGGSLTSRVYYEFFWWQIALSMIGYSFVKKMSNEATGAG